MLAIQVPTTNIPKYDNITFKVLQQSLTHKKTCNMSSQNAVILYIYI